MKDFRTDPYIHVKIAGGATAQCLGLMNAVYASNKLGVPFKISYYPFSTGTYWPFAINFLLNENEVLNLNMGTKGLANTDELETGKIIKAHPLFRSGFSYEKFLSLIRRMKLESKLQFLRRELAIKSSPVRLIKISKYYKTISGGFAQINEPEVNKVMGLRFEKAKTKSPFTRTNTDRSLTIIHYRLGDKKATPGQMQHTKDFNTDLIIDPDTYLDVLNKIENGYMDQHEGSYEVGLLLKKIYVDSALKKAEKLDAEHSQKEPEYKGPQVNVSWSQFKKMQGKKK